MTKTANSSTARTKGASKPKWWTDGMQASWDKVKLETVADWKKISAGEKKVETRIDEGALAFGHGAREAYHQIQVWGGELETKLKADWKETAGDAGYAWDKVSAAVERGWERAAAAVKSAPSVAARDKHTPSTRS